VDEYISEKEQLERLRDWWRSNGWYLLGGAALGLLALLGYRQYHAYMDGRAENASVLYRQLESAAADDNLAEVERLANSLHQDFVNSPYADHASLMVARMVLVSDTQRAADELRRVMDNTSDDELANIARLRLARVLAYQERFSEALELLQIPEPGPFAARIAEIRGDILLAQGDINGARASFAEALVADGSDLLDRSVVQMKLSNLLNTPASSPIVNPAAVGGEG
jgi:predicted negative regulator of RcsB-dependent stress response